jgi:putative ABC transport system permease protein
MGQLVSEARHALRRLARQTSFTLTTLTTIGVAIGANTLIFALVHGILLRPIGVPQPEELVRVEEIHQSGPVNLTGATFLDLREKSRTLRAIAAFRVGPASVSDEVHAVQGTAATVTNDYFPAIGLGPIRGRVFVRADFVPNTDPTVVISRELWQRLFNADPSVTGRTVLINAVRRQVVGIMDLPASAPGAADLWLPYPDDSTLLHNRRAHLFAVIARISPGASPGGVNSELDTISSNIRRAVPDIGTFTLTSTTARDRIVRAIRPTLIVLSSAVLVLLAVGFANVSSLVLVQGTSRARELSIRTALGAGRSRLVRQLLVESTILGLLGGVIGTVLGAWAVPVVCRLLPASVPRVTDVSIDTTVMIFGVLLSIACALAFGIIPALRASVRDPMDALRSRETVGGSSRLRDALVSAEVALTLMLLVGAGLVGRTLISVSRVPLGFDPENVTVMDLSLPAARYDGMIPQRQFYDAVLERLTAIPGVTAAGVSGALPLMPTAATGIHPQDGVPNLDPTADIVPVTPAIFPALRIPLVRGRLFDGRDRSGTLPVAIVSASAARDFWPAGTDPIGRAITMHDWGEPYRATVVGIVGDVHQSGPDSLVSPTVYFPFAQFPETTLTQSLAVRTTQPADLVIAAMRDIIRTIDRDQPIAQASTMADRLSSATAQRRVNLLLLGAFAAAALLMAAVGVYGVVASAMAARTREIGVRMALGATRLDIARLGTIRGAGPVLVGVLAGMGGALLEGRAVQGLLYGVTPHDPPALLFAVTLVLLVALAAVSGPVRRAMRIDPLNALRAD